MNTRISPKERGLLKGAIRRIFSRSELRRKIVDSIRVEHYDTNRPRVKKWSKCPKCSKNTPTYLIEVDHIIPIIPIDRSFLEMSLDEVVDRIWCEPTNLQAICKPCHNEKTKQERDARKKSKKGKTKK